MKIIESGIIPQNKNYRVTCERCECVFECNSEDDVARTFNNFDLLMFIIDCPECSKLLKFGLDEMAKLEITPKPDELPETDLFHREYPEELLPCPFCGGKAYVDIVEPHKHYIFGKELGDYGGGAFIGCDGCSGAISGETKDEAINNWNDRAKPTPEPDEPPKPERWRAELHKQYYYVDDENGKVIDNWHDDYFMYDNKRYESGNYFRTLERAEEYAVKWRELFAQNLE